MTCRLVSHEDQLRFEVQGHFQADDATRIEAVVNASPDRRPVLVDLRGARERHTLALWLLAQVVRRDPSRFHFLGLTRSDSRTLRLLGAEDLTSMSRGA